MAKTRGQRRSKLQEERIAEDIGGRRQPGSGNTWHSKGDVRAPHQLLVEAKYTDRGTFVIKKKDIDKIKAEAARLLEPWALQIDFAVHRVQLAILTQEYLRELRGQSDRRLCLGVWWATKTVALDLAVFERERLAALSRGEDFGGALTFFNSEEGTEERYVIVHWLDFLAWKGTNT